MAKTIPVEVRKRLVLAFDQGHTREEIAELYGVGAASISRFLTRRRETGSLSPSPRPGRTPILDGSADARIREWIREKSDLTLRELKERLEGDGYCVGLTAVFARLRSLGLSVKKNDARRRAGPARRESRTGRVAENHG